MVLELCSFLIHRPTVVIIVIVVENVNNILLIAFPPFLKIPRNGLHVKKKKKF